MSDTQNTAGPVIFEAEQLHDVLDELRYIVKFNLIYRLCVWIDNGAFKIRVNEGVWSPPFGREDTP